MKKHNLAFIDLETTGLDPETHEIIEIGGLVVKQIPQTNRGAKLEIIDEFEYKVKPENIEKADPEALRINGYNEPDWLFAAGLKNVMQDISEKTQSANLVAQNVVFDWSFLNQAFKKTGVQNKMHYHKIDVINLAFTKFYHNPNLQYFNLKTLAEHFNIKNEKAHTALADIKTTFEVYKRLLEID